MSRGLTLVMTSLLGIGLVLDSACLINSGSPPTYPTTFKPVSRPPRLIGCLFLNRANVTCSWEAGDTPAEHYTLEVERIPLMIHRVMTPKRHLNIFTCNTTGTTCTAVTNSSVRFNFCITVTAHGHSQDTVSQRRCQSGRIEVQLPPVTLKSVKPVRGRPRCLSVTWSRTLAEYPVSHPEIRAGKLKSQIEIAAQGQSQVEVKNVTVTDYSFLVCLLRPDTSYAIRLRHRYQGPVSPWSLWSNAWRGRTGEDAPAAAPAFWRQVKHTHKNGLRLVSLLWKPLPHFLANGRVVFYNVTCWTESAQALKDHGNCRNLLNVNTSCALWLPAGRCSCALTASNSAGTSPQAQIWLLGPTEGALSSPRQITAVPLNDSSLDVRWTAPTDQEASGFVVEWSAVREVNTSILYWEKLNSSSTTLVITEGVMQMERYIVSVSALYGDRGAGRSKTGPVYTREGAPSAGPRVYVQHISGSTVELIWRPVPVEQLHGFIRNYTVSYSTANQPTRRVIVPGHVHHGSLKNLLPGNYDIFIQANTYAGAGPPGPITNVHISKGSEDISVVMLVIVPLLLISLVVMLMVFVARRQMVKQKLFHDIPDPSSSSLARWNPKNTLERMKQHTVADNPDIKFAEVVLAGESEDATSQSIYNLQNSSPHRCSPLPASEAQMVQHARKSERCIKSASSSCPSICSYIAFSQTLTRLPAPIISSDLRDAGAVSVSDIRLPLGGDIEPRVDLQSGNTSLCYSPLSHSDVLKTCHERQQHVSFTDFSSIFHSVLCQTTNVTSAPHPFSRRLYNSVPFTLTHPSALSDHITAPLSHTVEVDFSYCPV